MMRTRQRLYGGRSSGVACGVALVAIALAQPLPTLAEEPPIPRPRPDVVETARSQGRPIEAIDRLVGGRSADPSQAADVFRSPVTGYAPPTNLESRSTLAPLKESQLYLVAKLAENGPPVDAGIEWRVFGELPNRDGKLPLLASAEGGDAEFRLKPGRYLVHAGFGRAGQAQLVHLDGTPKSEIFILDAGGVKLDATLNEGDPVQREFLRFEIFRRDPDNDDLELVAKATPGMIVRLAAGPYHIVSSYGGVNAIRTADFVVEPGKLTSITMEHGATGVTLKLVSQEGGEAIADTSWIVRSKTEEGPGAEIFAGVGAFPSMILANGEYIVEAEHRGRTFDREFAVDGGTDREIEVLAK